MIKRIINKAKRTVIPYITTDKKGKFSSLSINFSKFKRLIVLESTFGWDGIMMQRPQQIAASFDESTLVLYHSSKDKYETGLYCKKIRENLYVLNLDVYRNVLINNTADVKEKYLIVYSTDPTPISTVRKYTDNGYFPIYEYVDDLSPELCSKRVYKKLLLKHDYMLTNNVHTVCTATRLYNSVKDKTPAVLVTNGCDYDHFKAAPYAIPEDMDFKTGKPIVGYYGAVAEWMDYELLRKISKTEKYDIVLLGISYDGSFEQSGLDKLHNVHFLGKKSYDILPSYAANFDVCTIPFVCNDLTASTSPVKLFEYMAAEKPIVTTDLAECRKYRSVMCSKTHDEFIENLEKAVFLKNDENYKATLKQDALDNTWFSKCRDILNFVSGN